MKKSILLIVVLILAVSLSAQTKSELKISQKAKATFAKFYPNVKEVKWDKEGANYEASFKNGGKDMSIIFDNDGKTLETETAIDIAQLPKGIDKYIAENYKGFSLTGAAKIVKSNSEVLFEAEVTHGKEKKDLLFDASGKPEKKDVNKETEKEDEKN